MKLSGNTVLITGGTSGVGHALASRFLARGNTVLITGRTEERLAATRQSLVGVHTYVCDQSDPKAIARLHAEVVQAFPDLNILINNAGIGLKRNLNDASVPLTELEREIDTNLTGPIQLIAKFLPHLKRQEAAIIVNVTSGLAVITNLERTMPSKHRRFLLSFKRGEPDWFMSRRCPLSNCGCRNWPRLHLKTSGNKRTGWPPFSGLSKKTERRPLYFAAGAFLRPRAGALDAATRPKPMLLAIAERLAA